MWYSICQKSDFPANATHLKQLWRERSKKQNLNIILVNNGWTQYLHGFVTVSSLSIISPVASLHNPYWATSRNMYFGLRHFNLAFLYLHGSTEKNWLGCQVCYLWQPHLISIKAKWRTLILCDISFLGIKQKHEIF